MTNIMNDITLFETAMLSANKEPRVSKDMLQAEKSAQDFEAFFLTRMMESMFEGVSTDGMFGGGNAEKIYRSMLLDEYGKEMAKVGSIGVKDWVMRSILELQEQNSAGALG